MTSIALKARYVFPVFGPPILDGIVTIDGERIVAVGRRSVADASIDLGDVALLPGLVNAHTHLEFSGLTAPLGAPDGKLPDWIADVIALRSRRDYDAPAHVIAGLAECESSGTTMIGDVTTLDPQDYPADANASAGVTMFLEVISFSLARADSAFEYLGSKVASAADRGDVTAAISPHAPYTVSLPLIERLVEFANQCQAALTIHLAESEAETQFLHDRTGPFRDLLEARSMWDAAAVPAGADYTDYLNVICRANRALVVHGNYLESPHLDILARHADRVSLVYCPRTHAYFAQSRPYPLCEALRAGVCVALGTDSRASNPDLSVLEEMRFIARNNGNVESSTILELGTINGARALGCQDRVGAIEPGKLADLVAVELPDESGDPHELLFHGGGRAVKTWHRGRTVANVDISVEKG